MFRIDKPLTMFIDGKLNGAAAMIREEDEEFNKAYEILNIYTENRTSLLKDKYDLIYVLYQYNIYFDNLFGSHKEELVQQFTDWR